MQATQTNDQRERGILAQKLGALGPYQLRDIIGEGGMGAVYLADQTEPVQRRVAIKVTRVDLGSVGRLARFESERQILATLKHPHIAQVFDAGETGEGYPFMVMEYIDGVPIDQYATREKLRIEARIELILQACDAVTHAHQNGVIHRDLKPANLIVEKFDQQARVKLIDFGIAKLVEGAHHHLTETGIALGTPQYMSPEQSNPTIDIDTRTDVYSLGLTLYRLLTGSLPSDSQVHTISNRLEKINQQTILPSRLVRDSNDHSNQLTDLGLSAMDLSAALRGELDWIVLKAIAPERNDRYGSVRELGEDLQRFLAREPVLAAPPSRWYPIAKFFQRYRWQTAAVLVFFVTVAFAGLSLLRAWQEEREARALADSQLRQHRFFNDYLVHVLSTVKPNSPNQAVTMENILDHAIAEIPKKAGSDHQMELAVRLLMSRVLLETNIGAASPEKTNLESAPGSITSDFITPETKQSQSHHE